MKLRKRNRRRIDSDARKKNAKDWLLKLNARDKRKPERNKKDKQLKKREDRRKKQQD